MTYSIGQEFYYVPRERYMGNPRNMKITKIGRKWITLSAMTHWTIRADKTNLVVDGAGYQPPGVLYASKESYEAMKVLSEEWTTFARAVYRTSHRQPTDVTIEDIKQARALLRL